MEEGSDDSIIPPISKKRNFSSEVWSEATAAYRLGYSRRTISALASLAPFSSSLSSSPCYVYKIIKLVATLLAYI